VLKDSHNHLLQAILLFKFFSSISLIFLHELIDLFFFFVQDFILLIVVIFLGLVSKIRVNLLDLSLILLNHLSQVRYFLLLLLDFCVILFNAVHKSFSCLRERKVHLIALELQVILLFDEILFLFTKMLSTLL